MDTILTLVNKGNDFLWSFLLLILLCGTGIYYTIRLKFIQVRKFGGGGIKAHQDQFASGRQLGAGIVEVNGRSFQKKGNPAFFVAGEPDASRFVAGWG